MSLNRKDFRTSISLSQTVREWAEELMFRDGCNGNFSSLIADLVRHEHLRHKANSSAMDLAEKQIAVAALNEATGVKPPPPARAGTPAIRVQYPKAQRSPKKTKPKI